MDIIWNTFDRVKDIAGPEGTVVVFALGLCLVGYLALSSPGRG